MGFRLAAEPARGCVCKCVISNACPWEGIDEAVWDEDIKEERESGTCQQVARQLEAVEVMYIKTSCEWERADRKGEVDGKVNLCQVKVEKGKW